MNTFPRIALVSVLLACGVVFAEADDAKADIEQNGLFVSGVTVDLSYSDYYETLPAGVFALANEKLREKIKSMPDAELADAVISPRIGGFEVVFSARRRLTDKEEAELVDDATKMIREFANSWDQIRAEKNRANQRPERSAGASSVPPSTPGPGVAHP